ncbi:kinase [Dactylosporangium sp. NPDC000555]|uniref:phosphotransferase-like protein n=1 Tax=Dactylosporangium sp. NPDC000555 TaxID=3154260 RepID=UPI0033324361
MRRRALRPAVALYGPPVSGKDTVTAALLRLDGRYVAYQRLKVGGGRVHGYRFITAEQFDRLEAAGEILYRNRRYGNLYGVDRASLASVAEAGGVPVLHLGQVDALSAVEAFPAAWVRVLLWCPRAATAQRSAARGDTDAGARLAAWDETQRDLGEHPHTRFDLAIRTDRATPLEAARSIHAVVLTGSRGRTAPRSEVMAA